MLESLQRRPRARRLVALGRRLTFAGTRGRLAELEPLAELPLRRAVEAPRPVPGPVTRGYEALLGDWMPDLDRLPPDARGAWDAADADGRAFLRVMFAVWQRAPGFLARSGLVRDDPPAGVHAMARGPLAAGGGFHAADLVAAAVAEAGLDPAALGRALDFGASSGRVVRALAPAYPDVEWHACDPNAGAIAWAREHIPGVVFHASPQRPPLPFAAAGSFGLVYAISIWSHFSERAALRWLEEMHRIVRPDGLLVLTVQSSQTAYNLAAHGRWRLADVRDALADLYARGHHYRSWFGPGGDHGVASRDWGFALLSAEWLARHATPRWELALWRPGALEGDQDLAVLRRSPAQASSARRPRRLGRVPVATAR
jgi:SAM-dependent methyltransferase